MTKYLAMCVRSVDTPPLKNASFRESPLFLSFQDRQSAVNTNLRRQTIIPANGAPVALFFFSSVWINLYSIANKYRADIGCAFQFWDTVIGLLAVQRK